MNNLPSHVAHSDKPQPKPSPQPPQSVAQAPNPDEKVQAQTMKEAELAKLEAQLEQEAKKEEAEAAKQQETWAKTDSSAQPVQAGEKKSDPDTTWESSQTMIDRIKSWRDKKVQSMKDLRQTFKDARKKRTNGQ